MKLCLLAALLPGLLQAAEPRARLAYVLAVEGARLHVELAFEDPRAEVDLVLPASFGDATRLESGIQGLRATEATLIAAEKPVRPAHPPG